MRTSDRSASRPCSARVSQTLEPPWYGPVCPVVWEGWHREVSPYPDQWHIAPDSECLLNGEFRIISGLIADAAKTAQGGVFGPSTGLIAFG